MKKKMTLAFLALVCALCCVFGFAACSNNNTLTGNNAARYKTVCENIYTAVNDICVSGLQTAHVAAYNNAKSAKSVSDDSSMYVEGDADDYMNVLGVNMFVGMLGDMLASDKFVVTTKPVAFTHSYAPIGETCSSVLQYDFDETNNKVVMMWDVYSTVNNKTEHMFIYISTDYDFAENEVKAFTVIRLDEPNDLGCYNVYENEKLWKLKDDAAKQAMIPTVTPLKAQLQEAMKDTVDLKADFTAEYTKVMDAMNPELAA